MKYHVLDMAGNILWATPVFEDAKKVALWLLPMYGFTCVAEIAEDPFWTRERRDALRALEQDLET
jgi:hypothetical protein